MDANNDNTTNFIELLLDIEKLEKKIKEKLEKGKEE